KQIDIFDVEKQQIVQTLKGNLTGIRQMVWSPDSTRLASSGMEGVIILWDVASGREIARLNDHVNLSRHAVFSPDGARIAVADSVGGVRLFDTQTAELTATLAGNQGEVGTLVWQPAGRLLATLTVSDYLYSSGDSNVVRIWDSFTAELVGTVDH